MLYLFKAINKHVLIDFILIELSFVSRDIIKVQEMRCLEYLAIFLVDTRVFERGVCRFQCNIHTIILNAHVCLGDIILTKTREMIITIIVELAFNHSHPLGPA